MTADLHYLTIAEAGRRIATRTLSPVEIVEALLARIEALDRRLNSFITVTAEHARAEAKRAEVEILAGRRRGPLHGIPVAYKDIFATKGIRTTCHSRLMAEHIPDADATIVARLSEAGAILIGKLATHEFAFGGPSFDLPWPPARNPWDPSRFTGGSSSGSGAAVAAGFCFGALGSDSAGSIRTPAAMCGIVGLKPTYGRVSRAGAVPMSYSLDHCGPLTRTVEDAALMLQAIAGFDPADPASATEPVPDFAASLDRGVAGFKIGHLRHFYEDDYRAGEAQRRAMASALATFAELGAVVEEVRLSTLEDYHAACVIIAFTEAYAVHETNLKERPEAFGECARDRATLAAFFGAADYIQAQRLRRRLVAEIDGALARHDVLVTAAGWGTAPPIGAVHKFGLYREPYVTSPFSLVGRPAISVPCGFAEGGLPLGMQVVGRAFDEATVLRAAHAYERATAWHARRPPL